MAGKKSRAYFICPQWKDVAGIVPAGSDKVLAAIESGRPVARSALRRALATAMQRSGKPIDIDALIVDSRTGPASTTPRAE